MDSQRWRAIQGTFDALVQLGVVERSNRLAELCSTDPEVRAAVEALLAADANASARLAPIEAALFSPSAATRDPLGLADAPSRISR